MQEGIKLTGEAIIERRTKTGKVIDRQIIKNLIINTGKELVAKLLGDIGTGSALVINAIAIGTGTNGVLATDIALGNELDRQLATKSYEADYKAVFEYTFTFGSAYAITEAGLFDWFYESGSTMLDRLVFTAKNVSSTVDLYTKITITIS